MSENPTQLMPINVGEFAPLQQQAQAMVDKGDLSAILVTDLEKQLKARYQEISAAVAQARCAHSTATAAATKLLQETGELQAKPLVETLLAAVNSLSSRAAAKAADFSIRVSQIGRHTDGKGPMVSLQICWRGNAGSIDWTADGKWTKELQVACEAAQAIQQHITKLECTLVQCKLELADMPGHERRARAALARAVLTGTPDGTQMLARMSAEFQILRDPLPQLAAPVAAPLKSAKLKTGKRPVKPAAKRRRRLVKSR